MIKLNSQFVLLLLLLLVSCGKEDEPEEIEVLRGVEFSDNGTTYNFDSCALEFRSTYLSDRPLDERGFVYTTLSNEPTIADNKLIQPTPHVNERIAVDFEGYNFNIPITFSAYVIIDGEVFYSTPETIRIRYSDSFIQSVNLEVLDCGSTTASINAIATTGCATEGHEYGFCFGNLNGQELEDEECTRLGVYQRGQQQLTFTITPDQLSNNYSAFWFYGRNDDRGIVDDPKPVLLPNLNLTTEIEERSTFPEEGYAESVSFSIGEYGYVCGGYTGNRGKYSKELWRFDPEQNSWDRMTDFPGEERAFMSAFVVNDIAYVGSGGQDPNRVAHADFYAYDPRDDSWNRLQDIPTNGIAGNTFAIGQYGYLMGLLDESGNIDNRKTVYRYNTESDEWDNVQDFQENLFGARDMSASLNGKGYFIRSPEAFEESTIYEYDPVNNTWRTMLDFRMNCNDGLAFNYEDKIVIVTGRGADYLLIYDPQDNSLKTVCIDEAIMRSEAIGFVIDDLYVALGLPHSLDTNEASSTLKSTYQIKINE